jgi:hypothetical protein
LDVYGRQNDAFGGSFSSDGAVVTFAEFGLSGQGGVGLLVQTISLNYTQQITRLFEIGSAVSYYVGGRAQGQLSLARVVGPRPVQRAFYAKYGNVCNAATNTLSIRLTAGCGVGGGNAGNASGYSMLFCVITSLGLAFNAQDMIINEQLQLMFGALRLT